MNPRILFLIASVCLLAGASRSLALVDPGFNENASWTTVNNAQTGVAGGTAAPTWQWTSPFGGEELTFTETVLPTESTGMGLTIIALDTISQSVSISVAGMYEMSVKVNAISGSVAVNGASSNLLDGVFSFFAKSGVSKMNSLNFVQEASVGWNEYKWEFNLSPGIYAVGVENMGSGYNAVAFDEFSISGQRGAVVSVQAPTSVPDSGSSLLLFASSGFALFILRFLRNRRKGA